MDAVVPQLPKTERVQRGQKGERAQQPIELASSRGQALIAGIAKATTKSNDVRIPLRLCAEFQEPDLPSAGWSDRKVRQHIQDKDRDAFDAGASVKIPERLSFKIHRGRLERFDDLPMRVGNSSKAAITRPRLEGTVRVSLILPVARRPVWSVCAKRRICAGPRSRIRPRVFALGELHKVAIWQGLPGDIL